MKEHLTNLQTILQKKGFSLEMISKAIDVDISTIYRYTNGERNIPYKVLEDIVKITNIEIEELSGIRCPICGTEIPSHTYMIDRLGCKTTVRSKKKHVWDCINCGYVETNALSLLDSEKEVPSHVFGKNSIGKDLLPDFRAKHGLTWNDIVTVSAMYLSENHDWDHVYMSLYLYHKDVMDEIPLYYTHVGFQETNMFLNQVKDPYHEQGFNDNGIWEIRGIIQEPAIYLLDGTKITKNDASNHKIVSFFRNMIISSDFVVEHEDHYVLTKPYFVKSTSLAECIVKGTNKAETLDEKKLFFKQYPEKPDRVESIDQIIKNAFTYLQDINDDPNTYNNMSNTKYWYYIDDTDSFVANKFLAYKDNSVDYYKHFTSKENNKMDGGHARRILSKFFEETMDETIWSKFHEFKNKYNVQHSKNIGNAVLHKLK